MVGVLTSVIGAVLATAGMRKRFTPEVGLLAVGSAAGFAAIDSVYVAQRRISPICLADTVTELCLIVLWLSVITGRFRT